MTATRYTRLPGGLRGFLRKTSTWAGDDHVLLVSGTRFQERYHRVYDRDVLALVVERGRRFTAPWYEFVFVFTLLIAALSTINSRIPFLNSALSIAAGLVILFSLLTSFVAGCRVWIATAVGYVAVPGVARTWQARRFVQVLQSRVRVPAQGNAEAVPQ